RVPRQAVVAGEMGLDGLLMDLGLFESAPQGPKLLNVKYVFRERQRDDKRENGPVIEGIRFGQEAISLNLVPGGHVQIAVNQVLASELAIVSLMANSVHIPDETPAARIRLHTKEGRVIEREIRAGRDSAEWAYDREDVRVKIKHRRPPIAESSPADGFKAYRYLSRIPFDRTRIERIEFDYLLPDALILIQRASLFDPATGESTPLDLMNLPA